MIEVFDLDGTLVKLAVDWPALRKHLNENYNVDWFYEIKDEKKKQQALEFIRLTEVNSIPKITINTPLCNKIKISTSRKAIFSMNTRKAVLLALQKAGIDECFDFLVCLEDVVKVKPNPEGLQKILEHFNAKPNECIYYGDKNIDEEAAKALGVEFDCVDYFKEKS